MCLNHCPQVDFKSMPMDLKSLLVEAVIVPGIAKKKKKMPPILKIQ